MLQHTSGGYARQLTRRQRESLPHLLAPGSVSEKARNAGGRQMHALQVAARRRLPKDAGAGL